MHVKVAMSAAAFMLAPLSAYAGTLATLHAFTGGDDGARPETGVIVHGGLLYGTTFEGGGAGCKQIGCGTLFSVDPASGLETVLATFPGRGSDGDRGGLPYGAPLFVGGEVIGVRLPTTKAPSGAVYVVKPNGGHGGKVKALYAFVGNPDAALPESTPVLSSGVLIGTSIFGGAHGVGAIYTVDPATGTENVLYSFSGLDGADPAAPVTVDGTVVYGITARGGANGVNAAGAIYQLDISTNVETVLYSFGGINGYSSAPLLLNGSVLFGTVNGQKKSGGFLFQYDLATATFTILHKFAGQADGNEPGGPLTLIGQTLYGTTSQGGSAGLGTIFAYNLAKNTETVLYNFSGKADGGIPAGSGLTNADGILYGTTQMGGKSKLGTVFSFSP